jgi:proteic killer suppression protein
VIKSFKHKGVERFFTTGSKKGVQPDHARRLKMILFRLYTAEKIYDMNFPGSELHQLKGKPKGHWAVKVSGSWRVTFRFERGNVWEVDYDDYH